MNVVGQLDRKNRVIEYRGMIGRTDDAAIRIDQDVFGADPHFLQQAAEQRCFVLTIAVASMKNVARGMRLVSADADLDRHIANIGLQKGRQRPRLAVEVSLSRRQFAGFL